MLCHELLCSVLQLHLGDFKFLLKLRYLFGELFELGVRRGFTGDTNNDVRVKIRELKAAVGATEDRKIDTGRLCNRNVTKQIVFGSLERSAEGYIQGSLRTIAFIPR